MEPDLEKMLGEVQLQNQQLQNLLLQKQTITLQVREAEKALEELNKAKDDGDIFKAAGPILLKTTKAESTKELSEMKEELELRLKTVEKQENKIKELLQTTQDRLQSMIKPHDKE